MNRSVGLVLGFGGPGPIVPRRCARVVTESARPVTSGTPLLAGLHVLGKDNKHRTAKKKWQMIPLPYLSTNLLYTSPIDPICAPVFPQSRDSNRCR